MHKVCVLFVLYRGTVTTRIIVIPSGIPYLVAHPEKLKLNIYFSFVLFSVLPVSVELSDWTESASEDLQRPNSYLSEGIRKINQQLFIT